MDFILLQQAVKNQFDKMAKNSLYVVDINKDELYEFYLNSFPEGTNNIFEKRREYDCNTCKQFIKRLGNVVSITDNYELESIWDIEIEHDVFKIMAKCVSEFIKTKTIENVFISEEANIGYDHNHKVITDGTSNPKIIRFNHLFAKVPNNYIIKNHIGEYLSLSKAMYDVGIRGLNELTMEAIDIVLELINDNNLYRGKEYKDRVSSFREMKIQYDKLPVEKKNNYVWKINNKVNSGILNIRNTAIGTLLVTLSEGADINLAVSAFESKVDATNYKRTTSIVTKSMISNAKQKIEELGLIPSLKRRYANLDDLNIKNLLYVDRNITTLKDTNDDIFGNIDTKVSNNNNFDKVTEIDIETFIKDVLPTTKSLEVFFENEHVPNLVSLTTVKDPEAKQLFRWDNHFGWAYTGNITDSIKERVKKAGGETEGDLCCRLSWFNIDDLDLQMVEPNGYIISFKNSGRVSENGGMLDVDMNAQSYNLTDEPVENINYFNMDNMQNGVYTLRVHNYRSRENTNSGFEIEIDHKGKIYSFSYPNIVKHHELIVAAVLQYDKNIGLNVTKGSKMRDNFIKSKTVWNINTCSFIKVNSIMLSPNFWDGQQIGNKHYFFMLNDCKNNEGARGFFNEFLRHDLHEHRKVFEYAGANAITEYTDYQLSGLGFSDTKKNHLVCKVNGNYSRILKVTF